MMAISCVRLNDNLAGTGKTLLHEMDLKVAELSRNRATKAHERAGVILHS